MATSSVRLDNVPLGNDLQSWVLTSDGTTLHNNDVISRYKEKLTEGDVLVSNPTRGRAKSCVSVDVGVSLELRLTFVLNWSVSVKRSI